MPKRKVPSKQASETVVEEAASKRSKRQTKTTLCKKEDDSDESKMSKQKLSKAVSEKGIESDSDRNRMLLNKTETVYDDIEFSCLNKSPQGKMCNFRISSWNVDGLRAWLKKGGLAYIEHEKPDIFCLQETKCSEDKLPEEIKNIDGYKQYWHNGEKEGYAGVGLLSLTQPLSVKYGIGVKEHDQEGRCVTAEYDEFYVVSVYVPNAGRKLVTLPKRLEWNRAFKNYIKDLDNKKPVIVCGDMNVAHNEIDLENPKTNTKNAGFTKEEREGFTDFLADGYIDTFRKFYPGKIGAYTFWTYMMKARSRNVGWRLDYFVVSERFMEFICDSAIRNQVFGSDHCPIVLFLAL